MADPTVPINPSADQLAARTAASPATSTTLAQDQAKASNQGKPGYDTLGNAIPGYTAPAGSVPSPSEYYSRVGTAPTPVVAQSADDVAQAKLQRAQGLIDNTNKMYDSQVAEQTTQNDSRTRGTDAISTLTGLGGSTEANVAADKTSTLNKSQIDAINNQRAVAIGGILSKINDAAVLEAKQSRDEARQSQQDSEAYRLKAQTDATDHLTQLSKMGSGTTLEGLKNTLSSDEYNYLVKNAGGEDAAQAILFNNRPKSTILGTPQVFGNGVFQAYTAPDGSVKYESVPLPAGVNPSGIQSIEKTDKGIFIINKDGTWKSIENSGANPTQKTVPLAEQKMQVIDSFTNAFSPGQQVKVNGQTIDTIDKNGYANPTAWKEAIKDAPSHGITRADFIKNFGQLIYTEDGKIDPSYGLTTVEQRLILGAPKASADSDQALIDSINKAFAGQ